MRKLPWVNPMTTFGVFVNQRDGSLIDIINYGLRTEDISPAFRRCRADTSSMYTMPAKFIKEGK